MRRMNVDMLWWEEGRGIEADTVERGNEAVNERGVLGLSTKARQAGRSPPAPTLDLTLEQPLEQ